MQAFFIFGIGLAFFLWSLLLTKKSKPLADKILAAWLLIIGVHLLLFYLFWIGYTDGHPKILGFAQPLPLVHGPLLLLYVWSQMRRQFRLQWVHLLHFIPALAMAGMMIPFFWATNIEVQTFAQAFQTGHTPWYWNFFGLMTQFSGLIYSTYCLILLRSHRKNIHNWFAFEKDINLDWLRYMIWGILGIWLAVAVGIGLEVMLQITLPIQRDVIIFSVVTLFVFFLGFFGIQQGVIYSTNVETEEPTQQVKTNAFEGPVDIKISPEWQEAQSETLQRVRTHMEEARLYLEPKLSLPQLAEKVDLSTHQLSQLINEQSGHNFYQFVNEYRVKAFQNLALDPAYSHMTLLALALECGFNSKSTFNDVFRKMTNKTPSAFLKAARSAE